MVPSPSVYYKLDSFTGDLNDGPIIHTFDDAFYAGTVTLEKGKGVNGTGFTANGILDVLGKVDWLGLGTQLIGQALPLLSSI